MKKEEVFHARLYPWIGRVVQYPGAITPPHTKRIVRIVAFQRLAIAITITIRKDEGRLLKRNVSGNVRSED